MLCNGVIVFDDGGELLPDGRAIPPGRPPWPVRWQWPPEVVMTLMMSWAKAQRAEKFVTAAEWARLGEHALSETRRRTCPWASA